MIAKMKLAHSRRQGLKKRKRTRKEAQLQHSSIKEKLRRIKGEATDKQSR